MTDRPKGFQDVPGVMGPDEIEKMGEEDTAPQEHARAEDDPRMLVRRGVTEAWQLLMLHLERHMPRPAPPVSRHVDPPPRLVGRIGKAIPYMRAIPWVLIAGFVASFFWDFPGMMLAVPGALLPLEGLLRILSVAGLIGFGTNWLAITMLFQPREKRPILPQGLIPQQRDRVIYRLAEAISRELINEEIIQERIRSSGIITRYRDASVRLVREVIDDPEFRGDLKTLTSDYVEEVLGSEAIRTHLAELATKKIENQVGEGLFGLAFQVYRNIKKGDLEERINKAVSELPEALNPLLDRLDASLDGLPKYFEAQAPALEELATRTVLDFVGQFDVRAMIISKASGFDEQELERLLKTTSNEQLNYIKYLGGILGVVGGLVIWQPLPALAVLGTLTAAVFGLDEGLARLARSKSAGSADGPTA